MAADENSQVHESRSRLAGLASCGLRCEGSATSWKFRDEINCNNKVRGLARVYERAGARAGRGGRGAAGRRTQRRRGQPRARPGLITGAPLGRRAPSATHAPRFPRDFTVASIAVRQQPSVRTRVTVRPRWSELTHSCPISVGCQCSVVWEDALSVGNHGGTVKYCKQAARAAETQVSCILKSVKKVSTYLGI